MSSTKGPYRALAYLLAANVEAVVLLFAASYVADWLESHYPQGFDWLPVTIGFAVVGIVHSWYRVLRVIHKQETGTKRKP